MARSPSKQFRGRFDRAEIRESVPSLPYPVRLENAMAGRRRLYVYRTPASARNHQEDDRRPRELPLTSLSSGPYRRDGFLSDETIVVTEHPLDV